VVKSLRNIGQTNLFVVKNMWNDPNSHERDLDLMIEIHSQNFRLLGCLGSALDTLLVKLGGSRPYIDKINYCNFFKLYIKLL